ncbi:serine/threonine protein kinase [Microbacterium mangrovi]|uniref:non-specific serine/threonine protein kinase n=1 Tax=Microbacterium mangrovi TaxID=1348253 RepID=A0A0B1ZZ27_9MICO|nr:Stk1 family PASTA domain-containing Ser/Thr kinase [Microbacterium mangrovi]KHK96001.1 serine/threonine protein kinase [Microbacterium mangrovi]
MTDQPRVLAGRYRVDALIGHGGMAEVYRGRDLTLGRDVAIKILNRELAQDGTFRTRFRMEAQAASRMSHPTIVRVYDAGEDTDSSGDRPRQIPYIVMELVHGTLLKDIIARGPVPVDEAIRYTDGILEALEYSHRAGVVHRDIKPGNVMVTGDGQIKVMDFGIARAVSDSSSTVAETTQIIGTAAYFSPEQAKGESVDGRTDLYSTGVVLYELLTGRQPFRGESPVAVAYQHVSEAPEPPSEVIDTIPAGVDAVVLRALAKDPFQRFSDAAAFREALDAAASGAATAKKHAAVGAAALYGPDPQAAADTARTLRQLSDDTTMSRTQSGPPAAWIWAGVALLAVLLISVFIWVLSMRAGDGVPGGARLVPDVSGLAYDNAANKLTGEDLVPTRVDEPSDTVAKGTVVETDPGAGVSVAKGQEIKVFVSSGPDATTVPKLEGLSQQDATTALEDAGLTLGAVRQQDDPNTAQGIVLSADQQQGTAVPKGTSVDLVIATGTVTVVDLTAGYTLDDAVAALKSLGLTATVQDDPSCAKTDPRSVNSQSAGPGEVPIHSTVTLVSCSG